MPEIVKAQEHVVSCQSTIPSIDQLYAQNHQLKTAHRALIEQLRAARATQSQRQLVGVA